MLLNSKKRSFSEEDYQVSRMCKTLLNFKLNQTLKATSWSQIFDKRQVEKHNIGSEPSSTKSCNFCNLKVDLVECKVCELYFCSKCSTTIYEEQYCYSKCLDCQIFFHSAKALD